MSVQYSAMSSQRRHLPIDDQFDIDFANAIAHFETYNKHHYRPNTYLHKWWGRRCGSTFRLILKGLETAPNATSYYQPGGLEGKVILDPMMGGGTTLHEALRLGANVIGVDVDPIPVLQARASLTGTDRDGLEAAFLSFFGGVRRAVEPYFMTSCPTCELVVPLRHALYGQRRRCGCRDVLVVDSLVIRREADGTVLRFCPACGAVVRNGQHDCPREVAPSWVIERSGRRCSACDEPFEEESGAYYSRYTMLAVAGRCPRHGAFYKAPDAHDRELWAAAERDRPDFGDRNGAFAVDAGQKSYQLLRRGITNYLDLYSSRQLLFLAAVIDHLPDDPAQRLDLALLVSTSLEFNSMLSGYKGSETRRAGAVRHTFSHHAYAFPYTALENNPVYPSRSSGTLQKLFYGRLLRGREWAEAPRERVLGGESGEFLIVDGEKDYGQETNNVAELAEGTRRFLVHQTSADTLPLPAASVDAVVTDPPYYDSIQYDDLAAYFRVWLQQMVPDAADWARAGTKPVDTSGDDEGRTYALRMSGIFGEARRVLRPENGRLIFTFHHWQPEAWASLTCALHGAGFRLLNRYVVHAEHPMSVHISNMRALTHDAILVLAPTVATDDDRWPAATTVPRGGSAAFVGGCGALLGYMLQRENVEYAELLATWRAALQAA